MKKLKILVGSLILGLGGTALVLDLTNSDLFKKEENKNSQYYQDPKIQVIAREVPEKDLGFKLKVGNCFLSGSNDYIVVDIEEDKKYVLASAKHYYAGPHPIKDSHLLVIDAKEMDTSREINLLSCSDLEKKYGVNVE